MIYMTTGMYNIIIVFTQEYTNTNNPFGDHHLLEKFVWHKVSNVSTIFDVLSVKVYNRKEIKNSQK